MRQRWLAAAVVVAVFGTAGGPAARSAVTPSPTPSQPGGIESDASAPSANAPVLSVIHAGEGLVPTVAGLTARLANLIANPLLGPNLGLSVVDVGTGGELFGLNGNTPLPPASTAKVLTAAAVLATLGSQARLHTRVVELPEPSAVSSAPTPASGAGAQSPTDAPVGPPPALERTIVLVGGGDPMLTSLPTGTDDLPDYPTWTHLDGLATQTARALRQAGVERVRVRYDDSLFSGPAAAPQWVHSYTGDVVGPVTALSVDNGRTAPADQRRVRDPAAHSAALFVDELRRAGLTVLDRPSEVTTPPGAPQLADVASTPISAMLEHMLVYSDNDVAEAMARQVAIHDGRPGSFVDGAAAVRAEVAKLGVDLTGVTTYDGSGLSRDDRIPPKVLAEVLAVAAAGPNTVLRPLVAGLAIAGLNGTFEQRFAESGATGARGVLRAKSGTLTGVVALTGILPDADGRLISFAILADAVADGSTVATRQAVERLAAALVSCGCN